MILSIARQLSADQTCAGHNPRGRFDGVSCVRGANSHRVFLQLIERAKSTYLTSRATRSRSIGRHQARILRVLWQLWIMQVPAKQENTLARKDSGRGMQAAASPLMMMSPVTQMTADEHFRSARAVERTDGLSAG